MNTWDSLTDTLEKMFGKKPESLESIFFLIGMQELGRVEENFSKEQKQDILHIGICSVLEKAEYYIFAGKDEDGWPHYTPTKVLPSMTTDEEETFLKKYIIAYFENKNIS